MRAISLWQPWASLMAIGAKTIETRSWPTKYRGPLAIHASKQLVLPNDPEFLQAVRELGLLDSPLPQGAIVGICEIYYCARSEDFGTTNDREYLFGNFNPGRFLWLTRNMRKLETPIPCRGRQGLWDWAE